MTLPTHIRVVLGAGRGEALSDPRGLRCDIDHHGWLRIFAGESEDMVADYRPGTWLQAQVVRS